jgi:hypothetical protein
MSCGPAEGPRYADRLGPQTTPARDATSRAVSSIALLASAQTTGARPTRRNGHAPNHSARHLAREKEPAAPSRCAPTGMRVLERCTAPKAVAAAAGQREASRNVTLHAAEPSQRAGPAARALRRLPEQTSSSTRRKSGSSSPLASGQRIGAQLPGTAPPSPLSRRLRCQPTTTRHRAAVPGQLQPLLGGVRLPEEARPQCCD